VAPYATVPLARGRRRALTRSAGVWRPSRRQRLAAADQHADFIRVELRFFGLRGHLSGVDAVFRLELRNRLQQQPGFLE
jgi:hypothetical protein